LRRKTPPRHLQLTQGSLSRSPLILASPELSTRQRSELRSLCDLSRAADELNLSYCFHLLLLFGPNVEARQDEQAIPLLQAILDPPSTAPFLGAPALQFTDFGMRFKPPLEAVGESHLNQGIAVLAQLGISLDCQVAAGGHRGCVCDILSDCMVNFDRHQPDGSWALVAFAIYLNENPRWVNRLGDTCDLEAIVNDTLSLTWEGESCGGAHRLAALTYYLLGVRAHRLQCSAATERRLTEFLRDIFLTITAAQADDGSIAEDWHNQNRATDSTGRLTKPVATFETTSHIAEWLTHLPGDIQDDSTVRKRAISWLIPTLDRLGTAEMRKCICPVTHALKAIAWQEHQ